MTYIIHIRHEGTVYHLPNYPTVDRARAYLRWYGKHYGETPYRIEARAR